MFLFYVVLSVVVNFFRSFFAPGSLARVAVVLPLPCLVVSLCFFVVLSLHVMYVLSSMMLGVGVSVSHVFFFFLLARSSVNNPYGVESTHVDKNVTNFHAYTPSCFGGTNVSPPGGGRRRRTRASLELASWHLSQQAPTHTTRAPILSLRVTDSSASCLKLDISSRLARTRSLYTTTTSLEDTLPKSRPQKVLEHTPATATATFFAHPSAQLLAGC